MIAIAICASLAFALIICIAEYEKRHPIEIETPLGKKRLGR